MSEWTVWVGGIEVNEYHLDKIKADEVAKYWTDQGYTDVIVEKVR